MAVISVKERFQERKGKSELGIRTYTRSWLVTTNAETDSVFTVGSAAGLPLIGSTHNEDANAYLKSLEPKQHEGSTIWLVTGEYTSEEEFNTNPLNDPAKVSWFTEQFQEVAVVDKDDDPVVNSAGDPFDPPAMKDHSRRVARVRKNLAVVPSWILSYEDAVNTDGFTVDGFAVTIGKAKCQRVQVGEPQERNGTTFREVSFELHLSRTGWDLSILDAGFREKDGTDRKNMKNDGDSERPTAPILLDGTGLMLANPSPSTAVFLDFEVYPELPFSALPLT